MLETPLAGKVLLESKSGPKRLVNLARYFDQDSCRTPLVYGDYPFPAFRPGMESAERVDGLNPSEDGLQTVEFRYRPNG